MLADELNYGVVTNLVDIDTEGEKVIAKKKQKQVMKSRTCFSLYSNCK